MPLATLLAPTALDADITERDGRNAAGCSDDPGRNLEGNLRHTSNLGRNLGRNMGGRKGFPGRSDIVTRGTSSDVAVTERDAVDLGWAPRNNLGGIPGCLHFGQQEI